MPMLTAVEFIYFCVLFLFVLTAVFAAIIKKERTVWKEWNSNSQKRTKT